MIDLHMHTKYSDGDYTVKELINILNKNNIKYASITDHNNIDAHIEYEENNYQELFNGTMIRGVELQTIVDDYIIEVLVYNYDLDEFKKFVDETRKKFWLFHFNAYQKLLKVADDLGLKYIEPKRELGNGYYSNMKFQDAIRARYQDNINIVSEDILTNHLYFYRHEFQNINSPFYIDNKASFPTLEEVIRVAHKCHGKVYLAHIDEYQVIKDKEVFLKYLANNYSIDGLECFHPSISKENRYKYIEIAKLYNLQISAGSDFHGPHLQHRKNIDTEANLNEIFILKKK